MVAFTSANGSTCLQTRALAQLFLGALAQLVERLHGMQEVVGSIPTSSTKTSRRFGIRESQTKYE